MAGDQLSEPHSAVPLPEEADEHGLTVPGLRTDIDLSKCVVPTQSRSSSAIATALTYWNSKVNWRSLPPAHFIDDGRSHERGVALHPPPLEGSGIADTKPLSDRS